MKSEPGILTLHLTSNVQSVDISAIIPRQTILLQNVRIAFDSDANAAAKSVIYLDLPFFSGNLMIDNNVGYVYLPLMVGSTKVTIQNTLQLPIYTSHDIPQTFKCRVLGADFLPVSDFVSLTVQFSYSSEQF